MPDTSITVAEPRQAATGQTSSKSPRLTTKVSRALDLMIEGGLTYQQAAAETGLTCRAMRFALDRPQVLAELKRRRQVFRASICAANDLRLMQIRDTSGNEMAKLGAIKALERIDEQPAQRAGNAALPGITVIISTGSADTAHSPVIDHNPLIDNDHG